jgi:radical SAM enzyme (TIGR01210 family)
MKTRCNCYNPHPEELTHRYLTLNHREPFSKQSRWKLAIGTNPCIRTRLKKRCVFCGFTDLEFPLPADQVGQVLLNVLKENSTNQVNRLELFVSGSFFDDVEVSPESRQIIFETLNHSHIPDILVESRPEFIIEKNLMSLSQFINPRRVTIAMGVETMNDQHRKYLRKGITTKEIVQSIEVIAKAGMNFQAYLLLKPPYLANDRQAIINFIRDVQLLIKITQEEQCSLAVAIQPMFIADKTKVINLFTQKTFRPPWLYTIAFVLKILEALKVKNDFRIILGNENDNINLIAAPKNYTHATSYEICSCSQEISALLKYTNESTDKLKEAIENILNSTCPCKQIWQQEINDLNFEEFVLETT